MSRNERERALKNAFATKEENATIVLAINKGVGVQIIEAIMEVDGQTKIINSMVSEVEINIRKKIRVERVINTSLTSIENVCNKLKVLFEQNKNDFLQTYPRLNSAVINVQNTVDTVRSNLPIITEDINSEDFQRIKVSKDELMKSVQNLKSASNGWYEKLPDGGYVKKVGVSVLKVTRRL